MVRKPNAVKMVPITAGNQRRPELTKNLCVVSIVTEDEFQVRGHWFNYSLIRVFGKLHLGRVQDMVKKNSS